MSKSYRFKPRWPVLVGLAAVAGVAYAATQISINEPFAVSDGANGDKPKIQRAGDGRLVVAYGDSPEGAGMVYDVKAQVERAARDVFVKTCMPDATKTCDLKTDWSAPINISKSALSSSISTDWRGTLGDAGAYPGDIDKANIKTSGPVMVLTWVSKYCPDGDMSTLGVVDGTSKQRAIKYLERDERVIPFSCTWMARSTNNGVNWSAPVQLSSGERDAIQDSSGGGFNTETKKGQVVISWQEDPAGLQLGEADGPGDGASGANVNGGTDVWYTYASVDLSVPLTPNDDFVLAKPVRLTDNWQGLYGIEGSLNLIYDGTGANVPPEQIEKGVAGAARPNIGMVGTTTILAYEETKGSGGLDEGKFVRYHAFPYATPPKTTIQVEVGEPPVLQPVDIGTAGCVISDPLKNARRVRFLTQSPTDAGAGGIQIAIYWKEGIYDKGGPSDIVVRRGMGGVQAANMVPKVDAACATSDYTAAISLASERAENISSKTATATTANLSDDTEANYTENALAHRGVLRGTDLWIGYSYTSDLVKLWAQLDNYNFWIRKFTVAGGWANPMNVTNIEDKRINVREPRIFGTPNSSATACPTENPADPTTTDPTLCQDPKVVFLAWGTQENVSPFYPDGGDDLGIYITVSRDGAATFVPPVRYSTAAGSLFQDDESAYEAQIVTRPDGTRFYGVWNQANAVTKTTVAEYASGTVTTVADPVTPVTPVVPTGGDDGGCTMSIGKAPFDPTLLLLAALGLGGIALRRARRQD